MSGPEFAADGPMARAEVLLPRIWPSDERADLRAPAADHPVDARAKRARPIGHRLLRPRWFGPALAAAVIVTWAVAAVTGIPPATPANAAPMSDMFAAEPAATADQAVTPSASPTAPMADWLPEGVDPSADATLGPSPTAAATPAVLFRMRVRLLVNVQQQWSYTCIAAAVQTELASALGSFDTSPAEQMAIYEWGRANLAFKFRNNAPGLDFIAWARALNYFGAGSVRYRSVYNADGDALLQRLAKAMRASGLPQGAVVHGATHAWTIMGFVTTADPAATKSFSVVGAYVAGPNMRGTDPPTGAYLSAADLLAAWETYTEPYGTSRYNGQYLAVVGLRG